MDIHQTEEQQVEAIKTFWNENGNAIIAGLVIGFAGFIGFNYYKDSKLQAELAVSDAYQETVEFLGDNDKENYRVKADQFLQSNGESSYSVLTAFNLAKDAAEHKDWSKAESYLTTAMEKAATPSLKAIATVRKARVQLQQEKIDAALATLSTQLPEAFKAQAEEIKGDAYLQQGKKELARNAYQAAITASGDSVTPSLQMKLDDLAENISLAN